MKIPRTISLHWIRVGFEIDDPVLDSLAEMGRQQRESRTIIKLPKAVHTTLGHRLQFKHIDSTEIRDKILSTIQTTTLSARRTPCLDALHLSFSRFKRWRREKRGCAVSKSCVKYCDNRLTFQEIKQMGEFVTSEEFARFFVEEIFGADLKYISLFDNFNTCNYSIYMPHLRSRFALQPLKKLSRLWPVVGLVGLRQVGKSTLLRDLLKISELVTLDDDDHRTDAENSPKVFLSKYLRPMVIDEIQKVPKLFDALKSEVDRKRIPGTFYITGSQSFSTGELTRESLTGRIGTLRLYPLTLREATTADTQLSLDLFVKGMKRGGVPVPMFLRDDSSRWLYWDSWLETTFIRDLARAYGKGYDLDFAKLVWAEISKQLLEGCYPEISNFSKDSRKVIKYLKAMESIFLLNRIPCHSEGIGRDHWIIGDSGLAAYLMKQKLGTENATLTLVRHYLYNEIAAHRQYALQPTDITYYKSARGGVIDFVVDQTPIKVIVQSSQALGWHEKGLIGAMKKLNSKKGMLCAPIEKSDPIKKNGITRVSWHHFSE